MDFNGQAKHKSIDFFRGNPTIRLHRSKIGGTKIGKRWTFTQEELDRFLEKHKSRVSFFTLPGWQE
jgi:hypothetical protein